MTEVHVTIESLLDSLSLTNSDSEIRHNTPQM